MGVRGGLRPLENEPMGAVLKTVYIHVLLFKFGSELEVMKLGKSL